MFDAFKAGAIGAAFVKRFRTQGRTGNGEGGPSLRRHCLRRHSEQCSGLVWRATDPACLQRQDVVERPELPEVEAASIRSGERESMISVILSRCSVPHWHSGINARASVMPKAVMV